MNYSHGLLNFIVFVVTGSTLLTASAWSSQPALKVQIEELEQRLIAEPSNLNLRLQLSFLHERNTDYKRALSVLKETPRDQDSYDVRMRRGYLETELGNFESAATEYEKAASSISSSEEAWLGLQWARMQAGQYRNALAAGARVLALNEIHSTAMARQGLSHYMLGEFEAALDVYQKAVALDPENGEYLLGIGFTLVKLGESKAGKAYCRRARADLGDDSRIRDCLSMDSGLGGEISSNGVLYNGTFWSTFLHYTNPWNQRQILSFSMSNDLMWKTGFGLWLGGTFARTVMRYQAANFWQVAPVLGLYYARNGFSIFGAACWFFSNFKEVANTKVGIVKGDYDGSVLGGGISMSGSFYPRGNAYQLDPQLRVRIQNKATITAGPELTIITIESAQAEQGSQNRNSAKYLWSGHLGLSVIAHRLITVFASGYGGWRQYAVDAAGLSVWSSDDLFVGGYHAGMSSRLGNHMALTILFRHEIGRSQNGLDHDFSVLGGSLGLHARF